MWGMAKVSFFFFICFSLHHICVPRFPSAYPAGIPKPKSVYPVMFLLRTISSSGTAPPPPPPPFPQSPGGGEGGYLPIKSTSPEAPKKKFTSGRNGVNRQVWVLA